MDINIEIKMQRGRGSLLVLKSCVIILEDVPHPLW